MKSITFVALASATLVSATPKLLNSAGDFTGVEAGGDFALKYSGCDSGCTITLETGPSGNLKPVTTLAADASGDTITVTIPENLVSGDYAFRIVDNSDNDPETNQNFSKQFPVEGSAEPTSSAATTSAATTSAASTESEASTTEASTSEVETTSAVETTSVTKTVTSSFTSLTTPAPTESESSTSTKATTSTATTTTTIPDSGAAGYQAQLGLVMAAAVAVAAL